MVIVTLTVKAAFQDWQCGKQVEDYLADALVNYMADGQEAEVCFTTKRTARTVKFPDIDWESDESVDKWHDRARREMGG